MIKSYRPLDMQNLEILNMTLENLAIDPVLPGEGRVWFSSGTNLPRIRAGGQNRFLVAPDDDFNFMLPYKDSLYINDTLLIYDIENSEYRRMKASVILDQMSTVKDVFKTFHAEYGTTNIIAEDADEIYFSGDGDILSTFGSIIGSKSIKYDFNEQSRNSVLAGPLNVVAAKPTFRHLTDGDMPSSYNPLMWNTFNDHVLAVTGNPHNVTISNLGYNVVTVVGDPGINENLVTEKSVRDALDLAIAGIPDVLYNNAAATPTTIGGIESGSTFVDQTMQQMWDALLYPYQVPTFFEFGAANRTAIYECGINIGGILNFTWNSTNPGNINANSLILKDETVGVNLGTGLANDGSETYDVGSIVKTVTGQTHQWSLTGTNSRSEAIAKVYDTITCYSPFYYGIGDAALSVASLQALTKQVVAKSNKTYSFSPVAQKMYFAYPASYGYLTSIKDPNGFNITGSFTVTTKSFTNNSPDYSGITTDYYVYESNDLTTQTAFALTFTF